MSIIPKRVKKSFKIALCSGDTASWTSLTNSQYNANYIIDIKSIVQDESLLDKTYNVTFCFRSRTSTTANANLNSDFVYSLHLNFHNKSVNSYSSNITKNSNLVGILDLEPDLYRNSVAGTALSLMLNAEESDNMPYQINGVRNLTNINLQVLRNVNDLYVAGSSDALTQYICVLTFTEAD